MTPINAFQQQGCIEHDVALSQLLCGLGIIFVLAAVLLSAIYTFVEWAEGERTLVQVVCSEARWFRKLLNRVY